MRLLQQVSTTEAASNCWYAESSSIQRGDSYGLEGGDKRQTMDPSCC